MQLINLNLTFLVGVSIYFNIWAYLCAHTHPYSLLFMCVAWNCFHNYIFVSNDICLELIFKEILMQMFINARVAHIIATHATYKTSSTNFSIYLHMYLSACAVYVCAYVVTARQGAFVSPFGLLIGVVLRI